MSYSMSRVQFQGQVIDFYQMKLETCVIPNFDRISTGKSIYGIIFVIQSDLQDQKVNFKVKFFKNIIFNKYKNSKNNTSFWCDFECRIHLW